MIELSTYNLELLRNDKELDLFRGRSEHDSSQILVLSPCDEYPAPSMATATLRVSTTKTLA